MKNFLLVILGILLGLAIFFVVSGEKGTALANIMSLSTKRSNQSLLGFTEYYRFSTRQCYDGVTEVKNNLTSCKSTLTWRGYAEDFCAGHCNQAGTKCGVNSFQVTNVCQPQEPNGFRSSTRQCYDGVSQVNTNPTSCKSTIVWQGYANDFCVGHCNQAGTKCGVNSFQVTDPCFIN